VKPAWRTALKAAAGAALLASLLAAAGPARLLETLRTAAPLPLAAGLLAYVVMNLLEGWRTLIIFEGYGLTFGTALRITLAGTFLGNFTPGMVGADVYKVYFLNRREKGITRPVALLLVLRVLGAAAVFALAGIGLLAGHGWSAGGGRSAALAGLTGRPRETLRTVGRALRQIRTAQILILAALSVLVAVTRALSLYFVARGFTGGIPFADIAVVVAFSVLGNAVPLTVGGLGVQEGAIAAGLVVYGVTRPDAIGIALVNRVFQWIVSVPGAVAFARSRPERKLRELP
jgi:uncharacterized membrane protein YbhN (UPF0104 family)